MQRVPKMQLHDYFARLELRGKPAQSCLIGVGRGADRELRAEFLGKPALQADDRLIAHLVFLWKQAVGFAQFFLRKALHADKEAALLTGAACPLFNQLIDGFPSTEIEIADAEVGTCGDFECLPQSRQQFEFDVVKDSWHGST